MKKRLLVTGSNGLIGSEMVRHFHALGWEVHGVDNNMRADFFGPQGDTRWNQYELCASARASRTTNSCSILEAFERVERLTGLPMRWEYVDKAREGDHICYISDLTKMKAHYPNWTLEKTLDAIFSEVVEGWTARAAAAAR